MSHRSVIAVHLGAGPACSAEKQAKYENICKIACKCGMKILLAGGNAVDAACEAVRVLENSPYTNAGIGSNLTFCEKVECDASVMSGKSFNFGAVGALPDIQNPVLVAKALLEEQEKGLLPLGCIPPCLVVAEGGKQWAVEHGFCTVDNLAMTTRKAQKIHYKNKKKLQNIIVNEKSQLSIEEPTFAVENRSVKGSLDTVGAVCVDSFGNVASAVSSGGIVLKHSGRVGQAAIFGAGCWAENGFPNDEVSNCHCVLGCETDNQMNRCSNKCFTSDSVSNPSVAVVTTGVGESLIKEVFSRECANSMKSTNNPHETLKNVFDKHILKSRFLKTNEEKLAGVLLLRCEAYRTEVIVAHTTATMCFGFLKQGSSRINVTMSRLPVNSQPGTCTHIQGAMIR